MKVHFFRTFSNLNDDSDYDDDDDENEVGEEGKEEGVEDNDDEVNVVSSQAPLKRKQSNPIEEVGKRIANNSNERLKLMKKVVERIEDKKDPCELDLFFKSVYSTVRKFSQVDQAKIKIDIMIMVGNYELNSVQSNHQPYQISQQTSSHSNINIPQSNSDNFIFSP